MALEVLIEKIIDASDSKLSNLLNGEIRNRLGLRKSSRVPLLTAFQSQLDRPVLLVTDRSDRALAISEELALWAPDVPRLFFPEPNLLYYENSSWGLGTRRDRLNLLALLSRYHNPVVPDPEVPSIIVAPVRAIMTRTIPLHEFLKATRIVREGQNVKFQQIVRNCVRIGYEHVNTVVAPGQLARRGGIIDLWPVADSQPTRIEFFGDEVDTLRFFDPSTQRTIDNRGEVTITPSREFIEHDEVDISFLKTLGPEKEINELSIPILHPFPATLIDFLPKEMVVFFDDVQAIKDKIDEVEEQAISLRTDSINNGTLPEDYPSPYVPWVEIEDSLSGYKSLELGPSFSSIDEQIDNDYDQIWRHFKSGKRFGGRLKPFIEYLLELCSTGDRVFIVSRQISRLQGLWKDYSSGVMSDAPHLVSPIFIQGSLSEGWTLVPDEGKKLHLLTDGEIFGWSRPEIRRKKRPIAESPEAEYTDLRVGDWVVHIDYGVGLYKGLVQRTIDKVDREYLQVEYAGESQLFVPVHQSDRINRYLGPDRRTPRLSRLGGKEWLRVRTHVKKAVQEVAEDLVELYAKRNVIDGHSFSPDTTWQKELEASFPYIETDDQVGVLAEVKEDMEAPRPMDRLICGDVGYGKTEVALRAAFKAVMDGKQVSILVPTTVLAQQHYHTFLQRLTAFPVEVEMLSRFRTHKQQKNILNRLAQGGVDIIIGTHRLLSKDVVFKELGLLIIDEEQRFGVTHKETLKKMRTEVDVLTLTATPIPRTLYMSLTGVRDISTIDTPPDERLPIVTQVGPYSKNQVRRAILRELERKGQVFFVHNRVQTIKAMRNHLNKLVPEAEITIVHGQMSESKLSQRMQQFSRGEVDVLLCTSIIESGLDIPNANTLIVDRADTFGLSQLYQLRGRVGRGAQRAYSYFFKHKRKRPTREGRMRLETIAENTQLGAGFSIAMRDLEIRGTGDILGTRQHGHIASVGFHLYTRLLAEAVHNLRKQQDLQDVKFSSEISTTVSVPVSVDLPLSIGIPDDYVPDKAMRLRLYRRIAGVQTLDEIKFLHEEFTDRFGSPPEGVLNLFFQLKIKLLAKKAGVSAVGVENGRIALRFPDGKIPGNLPDLGRYVRVGKKTMWLLYKNHPDWTELLLGVLEHLAQTQKLRKVRFRV